MKLNQTGSTFNRDERNDLNENWITIENEFNNVVEIVTDKAYNQVVDQIIDSARIEWLSPVDIFNDLSVTYPNAVEGNTVMVRDTGKIYRKNDNDEWIEIQDIDPTAYNELDQRLSNKIGVLSDLETDNKTNLVGAINENTLHLDQVDQSIQRLSEEITYLNVKNFGAIGDGITDDTLAIQSAIDEAYNSNYPLEFENKTYLIKSLDFKSNTYRLQGARFLSHGPITGNIYVIDCATKVIADKIDVTLKAGAILDRVVIVREGGAVDTITVDAEVQHSIFDDLIDSAVVIEGKKIRVGNINISNFDYALTLYKCDSSTLIENLNIKSYVRGLYGRQSDGFRINNLQMEDKSPNASFTAGHNGILLEDCADPYIGRGMISDSGEHGIRIGGVRDNIYGQKRFYFGDIIIKRAGGCGFKAYSGSENATLITTLHFNNLTTIDCSYQGTPGRNKDGLYIAGAFDVKIGSFRCVTENSTVAAYSGIYLSGVDKINIESVDIQDVTQSAIVIDLAYGRVNDLYVNSATLKNIGKEGILIDHSGEVLRDIIFKNIYLRNYGATSYGVKIVATAVYQPVVFDGYVSKGTSPGIFNSNITNANIYNKLVELA